MKFFACVLTAAVCLVVADANRIANKYLPPNFAAFGVASSSQYPHFPAASRVRTGLEHQYAETSAIAAAPVHHAHSQFGHNKIPAQIPILRHDYNNDGSGNYNFGFETGNGIKRDESGHVQGSWPAGSLKVAGSYSYTGDDGKLYSVKYKADSNGFHAEGDHLPTPPPIPREIQETLHLHQRGGSNQHVGAVSYTSGTAGTGHRNFAPSSHHFVPHANYLPPQQGHGYNYGRHH